MRVAVGGPPIGGVGVARAVAVGGKVRDGMRDGVGSPNGVAVGAVSATVRMKPLATTTTRSSASTTGDPVTPPDTAMG